MTRKQFVESVGASCRNWRWSWSFVNHDKKFVLFGAWDAFQQPDGAVIMSEDWEKTKTGGRTPAYSQSIEHLRLIEEEGYTLKVFTMIMANKEELFADLEPAKIGGFVPEIQDCRLEKRGRDWFAV